MKDSCAPRKLKIYQAPTDKGAVISHKMYRWNPSLPPWVRGNCRSLTSSTQTTKDSQKNTVWRDKSFNLIFSYQVGASLDILDKDKETQSLTTVDPRVTTDHA